LHQTEAQGLVDEQADCRQAVLKVVAAAAAAAAAAALRVSDAAA
jgi:hypothetical protein